MASLYDLLISADPATEAAALQDALRKRSARGALLQATGDRALAPMGAGMLRDAGQGEAGISEVMGQRLRNAMAKAREQAEQQRWEAEQKATGDYRNAQIGVARDRLNLERSRPPSQGTPYYTFLPSGSGYLTGNNRTGEVAPVTVNGAAPLPASADPALQGRVAEARAAGKTTGEGTAKAQGDLPRAQAQADELLRLTDELLSHPGFKQAVGTSSALKVHKIPGTAARDFVIRLDQIKGKQFLEAFNSLKGGGQITEAEGRKATEAIARMDIAESEAEFVSAVRDFQDVVRAGLERTRSRAAPGGPGAEAPKRRRFNPQTGTLE